MIKLFDLSLEYALNNDTDRMMNHRNLVSKYTDGGKVIIETNNSNITKQLNFIHSKILELYTTKKYVIVDKVEIDINFQLFSESSSYDKKRIDDKLKKKNIEVKDYPEFTDNNKTIILYRL